MIEQKKADPELSQEVQVNEPQDSADDGHVPETGDEGTPGLADKPADKAAETELLGRLQRLQADFENFKRRTRKDLDEMATYTTEGLLAQFLPVIDNLERAIAAGEQGGDLASFLDGLTMIYKQFMDVMEKQGVQRLVTTGQPFDPGKHHAVAQAETAEYEDNTVVEELQRGYTYKNRILRPAMVKVAKNPG